MADDVAKTVVVVGAGVAGLSAAIHLQQAGWNVIVVEARSRLGGRVFTNTADFPFPVDVGACWIHGIEGNPLMKLVSNVNIEVKKTEYESMQLFDAEGCEVPTKEFKQALGIFDKFMDFIFQQRKKLKSSHDDEEQGEDLIEPTKTSTVSTHKPDRNLGGFVDEFIRRRKLDPRTADIFRVLVYFELELEYAAPLSRLSLRSFADEEEFRGHDVALPGGYWQIFEPLAKQLRNVRLNTAVLKIEQFSESLRVHVHTSGGIIPCRAVVVTVPLAVLKARPPAIGAIEFVPPISAKKMAAIERLGMGRMAKVVLEFPFLFWKRNYHFIARVTPQSEIDGARKRYGMYFNWHRVSDRNVLIAMIGGAEAQLLDTKSDQEIVSEIISELRLMFPHVKPEVPEPVRYKVVRWGADEPYSGGGTYTVLVEGSSMKDVRELRKQEEAGLVWFAGEHTADHLGTVHGAWMSGKSAANAITRTCE